MGEGGVVVSSILFLEFRKYPTLYTIWPIVAVVETQRVSQTLWVWDCHQICTDE